MEVNTELLKGITTYSYTVLQLTMFKSHYLFTQLILYTKCNNPDFAFRMIAII